MRCSVSFPSHDLQRAWNSLGSHAHCWQSTGWKKHIGQEKGTFAGRTDMGLSEETTLRPPREWWSSPLQETSVPFGQERKFWNGGLSNHGLAPLPAPLLSPLHLISCGLRIQHLDEMPQICLFAADLSNVPSLHSSASSEFLHKGSASHGERLFLPILLLFWILQGQGLCCRPINCHKVNGLDLQATGLNFWEWDLLQTITWGYCDNLVEV